MKRHLILAIDQGTTGSTALILDVTDPKQRKILSKVTTEFQQHFPKPGWVEHHLDEIWQSIITSIDRCLDKLGGLSISNEFIGIGITNQRETLCVFDPVDSQPLCPAIVWQCRRSTEICARIKNQGLESSIREKTGLFVDPYFTGSKLAWLLEQRPDLRAKIESGQARLGTIDTWLIHKMTGGKSYVTESSNASRTLLFNIKANKWDSSLAQIFGLDLVSILPEVKPSAGEFGKTLGLPNIPDGIPITGVLGDQQAALAGQACFQPGLAKCTYGTGAFLLLNTGDQCIVPSNGILSTIAWNLNGSLTYALEGSAFIAGAAVQFLRDQMGFLTNAKEAENLAKLGHAAPDLYFVPALTGLGAPWWEPDARGAFLGLHRGTTKNDLIRAALEGIALQVNDLATSMASHAQANHLSSELKALRVDGGASSNDLLMEIQANLLELTVDRPVDVESTAIGAGMFAALGVGVYHNLSDLSESRMSERVFSSSNNAERKHHFASMKEGWTRAVRATIAFKQSS